MKLEIFCVSNGEEERNDITYDDPNQRNEDVRAFPACCKEQYWVKAISGSAMNAADTMCLRRGALVEIVGKKGLRRPMVFVAPNRVSRDDNLQIIGVLI